VKFLLDTNILSEVRRPKPNTGILQWLDQVDEDRVFISVITLAEIQRGISLLAAGRKQDELTKWLSHDLQYRFEGRILTIDAKTALSWGDLMAASKLRGFALASMDGFLAATAKTYDLTLVTHNLKDFSGLNIQLLDPWEHGIT